MKLGPSVYKTSGVEYGTNSNTFCVDTQEGIVLLDLGFGEFQWNVMQNSLKRWGLDEKPVIAALLTHGHYDHAGNVRRANEAGIPVWAADPDAYRIENGYPEMEKLFGIPWVTGHVDEHPRDGQIWHFGEVCMEALAAPGHSEGSFAYVIEADGQRALCTGDMFFVIPQPPKDAVDVELAFMGGEDFSLPLFTETLEKMSHTHCDLLLPGHYYDYYGDVDVLAAQAYEKALQEAGV